MFCILFIFQTRSRHPTGRLGIMGYKTYPCEVKFKYLIHRDISVMAFFSLRKMRQTMPCPSAGLSCRRIKIPVMPEGY